MSVNEKINSRLNQVSTGLILYTLLVILWGAWVRISHSGDGCGDTWPLCQGKLIPQEAVQKTWVEYSHRFTSGLYGVLVVGIYFWIKRLFSSQTEVIFKSSALKWSRLVLFFMITEALLGAKLVLFHLVNQNDSVWRLVAMSLHQLNSFLLVAFTVRLYCSSLEWGLQGCKMENPKNGKIKKLRFPLPLYFILFLAMTGAWAALSTTLFPSISLVEGLLKDFSADSHYLLKIRVVHPILGILLGSSMAIFFFRKSQHYVSISNQSQLHHLLYKTSFLTSMAITLAIVIGIITLLTLSPLTLKILHLTLAHLLWALFICYYHFNGMEESLQIQQK